EFRRVLFRSLAQVTLPPRESPLPGSVVPISANVSALPCVSGAGPRFAGLGAKLRAAVSAVAARAGGGFRDGDGGWLASTCCSARARPPNHEPAVPSTPSGSVRPAPASRWTLLGGGRLKN